MTHETEPLSADTSSKLLDLARACKAAARVVSMYPATHPAIQDALGRITSAGSRAVVDGPFLITVMPDTLLVGGRALGRPDQAVTELAGMLHAHSVGELNIIGALEAPAWHAFLVLIAQSPADIRDEGGIARAWEAGGGGPLEVRQIDYGEVLRERAGNENSDWENILTAYLAGEQTDLDDTMLSTLLEIANEPQRLAAFVDSVVERGSQEGYWLSKQKAQLAKLLQALAAFITRSDPGQLDRVLRNVANSLPRMSPEMVTSLLDEPQPVGDDGQPEGIDLASELRERIDETLVAKFVAQSVARDRAATARLAQAFQALVPDHTQRDRVLDLAAGQAASGPLGREPQFTELWRQAADILSSYTDEKFISEDYARDLNQARIVAVEMDKIGDDPPERVAAWVASVSDEQVRRLDQQVLGDLIVVETRPDEWRKVLGLAIARIEQLVLVGDLAPAQGLLDTLLQISRDTSSPFAATAKDGVTRLASGDVMTHVLLIIRQADDGDMPRVTRFSLSLGRSVVGRFIDALLTEDGARTIRRLREVLISFGSAARARVAELCASPNASVRRTAIELVRAIGGPEALPLLLKLLDDEELQVQRDALRAIVQTGTDQAFSALRDAVTSGSPRTRDMITGSISTLRDERAAPLFAFIVRQGHIHGRAEKVFLSAVEALGTLRVSNETTIGALVDASGRGAWWNPFQAKRLRGAAVKALRTIGTPDAIAALDVLARSGPYGARSAGRAARPPPPPPPSGAAGAGCRCPPRGGRRIGRRATGSAGVPEECVVSDAARQLRQADEFVRRLTAAVRANQLYAPSHPLAGRALKALAESANQMLVDDTSLAVGFIENEIVVGEIPLVHAGEAFSELLRRVRQVGIERITFDRGVTSEELALLIETLAHPERAGVTGPGQIPDPLAVLGTLTRIRVGRLTLDERVEASAADVATIRRLYTDGVSIAGALWEMTQKEGMPDPNQAKQLVDSLAQAVAQNRTALMALTALKDYDNYTFTHMVNVSILVMAQARSLGIDGTLLREFGLAALMHDIGKVRTPLEILTKPDRLTDSEFAIMRMHVVDGAEILRRTPEMPALAPVVAFEHHLRIDGSGYPMGVKRASLNLGTMLCSISDVYDAMRSQRAYQGAHATDRILAVLQKSDGLHFDQHLVRRFSQLMGLYPPGNMVRLDTGQVAVVIRTFAPDPRRPRVRVVIDASGTRLARPFDVSLWDVDRDTTGPKSVVAPVDPKDFGIDPLTYL